VLLTTDALARFLSAQDIAIVRELLDAALAELNVDDEDRADTRLNRGTRLRHRSSRVVPLRRDPVAVRVPVQEPQARGHRA